jgi:hypothetical protein
MLSLANIAVPYIPTAKERRRGRFWKLARVPIVVVALSVATLLFTAVRQLYFVPESEVLITTEVTFGMVTFTLLNAILMSGRLYAAWIDRERGER